MGCYNGSGQVSRVLNYMASFSYGDNYIIHSLSIFLNSYMILTADNVQKKNILLLL